MKALIFFCIPLTLIFFSSKGQPVLTSFSSGGHTVYHLRPATITKAGKRGVITASYDGFVQCFKVNGKQLWTVQPGKGFTFDLEVADIDNDGLDEAMVASSDGSLYTIDNDGSLMWTFGGNPLPPLYQVSVKTDSLGRQVILTGGIERILYTLSADGKVLLKEAQKEVVRFIEDNDSAIKCKCTDIIKRPYNMDFVTHIKSATLSEEYMLNLSGRNLMVYYLDGSCQKVLKAPLSFTGTAFDAQTNTYWHVREYQNRHPLKCVRKKFPVLPNPR